MAHPRVKARKSLKPRKKVVAGGAGGGAALAVVELLRAFGIDLPPAAGEAIVVLVGVIAAYFQPSAPELE